MSQFTSPFFSLSLFLSLLNFFINSAWNHAECLENNSFTYSHLPEVLCLFFLEFLYIFGDNWRVIKEAPTQLNYLQLYNKSDYHINGS